MHGRIAVGICNETAVGHDILSRRATGASQPARAGRATPSRPARRTTPSVWYSGPGSRICPGSFGEHTMQWHGLSRLSNHQQAIHFVKDLAGKSADIDGWNLRHMHPLVLRNLDPDEIGRHRRENVVISGAGTTPPDLMSICRKSLQNPWRGTAPRPHRCTRWDAPAGDTRGSPKFIHSSTGTGARAGG